MSNITVSTNSNFDDSGNLALSNGETVTIDSGAVLTINSDVRWAQNAAVIGNIVISAATGGELHLDGTTVWWIPYDGGDDVVPAIGDIVTGKDGGAYGEFIGLFTAMGVAPSAGGGATPATGFIKLRSKIGTFSDNEELQVEGTTFAVVNSATGGKRGWIHVVGRDANYSISIPRNGIFRITGDWFYFDDLTSGVRGQTIQGPVADYLPGVWIETAPSSDEYEFWPNAGPAWTVSDMPTDARGQFIEVTSGGLIRIGQTDGEDDVGVLPESGCRVRIPNVIISSANSSNYAVNVINAAPAQRWEINASANGVILFDKFCSLGFYLNCLQAYSVQITDSACLHYSVFNEIINSCVLENFNTGLATSFDGIGAQFQGTPQNGIQITNCKFTRYGATYTTANYVLYFGYSGHITVENVSAYFLKARTSLYQSALYITACSDVTLTNFKAYAGYTYITACTDVVVTDYQHCDVMIGQTTSSWNTYGINFTVGSRNCYLDGAGFPDGVSNVHPYFGLVVVGAGANKIRVKNIGNISTPLNLGSSNAAAYLLYDGTGYNTDVKVQQCYSINARVYTVAGVNSSANREYNNIWGDAGSTIPDLVSDTLFRGCYGGNNGTGTTGIRTAPTAIYGSHFYDAFHSDTRGKIGIWFNEKTNNEPSASSYDITFGDVYFDAAGKMYLTTEGDTIEYTWSYYILGYTGFTADDPQINGTNVGGGAYGFGKHRIEYCLDKNDGNGFGSWKELTAVNLNAETGISATLGFKPKVRISCISSDVTNAINMLYIFGATDATSQQVTYPLIETVTITLRNIVVGSKYRIEKQSDGSLVAEGIASAAPEIITYDMDADTEEIDVVIRVRNSSSEPRYLPFETGGTLTQEGLSIYISQLEDTIAA